MTLLRTIDEALMQCNLFANNAMKNDKTFLEKWFAGEIVKHSTTRKELNEYLPGFDTLTAYVYQMESQVSHNSYLSVLENISPVTQDFDFD